MKMPSLSFKGEWKLRVLAADGSPLRETDWFPNLVTNIGLDNIGNGTILGNWCRIGTGNTAAAYTDTQLVSQSASTNNVVATTAANNGAATYDTATTSTFQFALGAVVGNMAEIGVGTSASTAATLSTRALIVDGVGAPTTITILVTEILQAIYRFSAFPNLADSTGTVVIQGVSYAYTARQVNVARVLAVNPAQQTFLGGIFSPLAFNGAIGAYTAVSPAGTNSGFTSSVVSAYTNGNYYRDFTLTAALADANVSGGISAIFVQCGGSSVVFQTQIGFTPAIPKDNTKQLNITLRQFFSHH